MRLILLGVAAAFLAAGCGQRGPLYLSDNPPAGTKPPQADRYKLQPYPREQTEPK